MLLPHEFGIVDEMPDRDSKYGTARVALTAAPHRHKLNVDLSTYPESTDRGRGRLRGQSCVDPLNILVCGVSDLVADLSTACPKRLQKIASIPGSHKMREARAARDKMGHSEGQIECPLKIHEPDARSRWREAKGPKGDKVRTKKVCHKIPL